MGSCKESQSYAHFFFKIQAICVYKSENNNQFIIAVQVKQNEYQVFLTSLNTMLMVI